MGYFVPVKLAYNEFEPVGGVDDTLAPVIFLHGLTSSKENWCDIPQTIANLTRRKAYAYDARNHGDSGFSDFFDFDITVDDLFHFMDNIIKVKKAVLVGHSMGGLTSLRAALREPKRVEMLFIEDQTMRRCSIEFFLNLYAFVELYVEAVDHVPKDFPESDVNRFVIDYIASEMPPASAFHNEKENLYKSKTLFKRKADGGYDVKFNKDVILKTIKRDPASYLRDISGVYDGPVYFVYGEKSPFFVDRNEEEIKIYYPAAIFIKIKGAFHNIHAEFPEEFIQVISKYLVQAKEIS